MPGLLKLCIHWRIWEPLTTFWLHTEQPQGGSRPDAKPLPTRVLLLLIMITYRCCQNYWRRSRDSSAGSHQSFSLLLHTLHLPQSSKFNAIVENSSEPFQDLYPWPPFGNHFFYVWEAWNQITYNHWALAITKKGYSIQFQALPIFHPPSLSFFKGPFYVI